MCRATCSLSGNAQLVGERLADGRDHEQDTEHREVRRQLTGVDSIVVGQQVEDPPTRQQLTRRWPTDVITLAPTMTRSCRRPDW